MSVQQAVNTTNRLVEIGKRLSEVTARYPDVYRNKSESRDIFFRFSVVLRDSELFNAFWTHLTEQGIELEGMYVPLHLRYPQACEAEPCETAESVYRRVFNVPNRASLTAQEVNRIAGALEIVRKALALMNSLGRENREKYNNSKFYVAGVITSSLFGSKSNFSAKLLAIKRDMLHRYCRNRKVLDLGCADGRHLAEIADLINLGLGIDFSGPFIAKAVRSYVGRKTNLFFVVGDGRVLPIKAGSIDCMFSFATLYYVDAIQEIYAEVAQVLADRGVALLEVGNSRSFATMVSRRFPELAGHSNKRIEDHMRAIARQGLRVKEWRSFQILPMWGDRPRWLRVLRLSCIERFITKPVFGRMIDEWISGSWPFRNFAFRHLLVLEHAGAL